MKYKLNEYQYNIYKQFLNEDAESDSQKKAIQYLMDKYDYDKEDAEKYVRTTLREKLRILTNNRKVGKFTLGALRLYLEDCNSEKDVRNLYAILNAISENNELGKNYDRNFNGKSLKVLFDEIKPQEIDSTTKDDWDPSKLNTKYKIYKIENFQQSHEFSDYVSWCVTKSKGTLENYNDDYKSQFYFAVVDGYKEMDVTEHMNEDLLGEYGLSMIAICVNPFGRLKSCTCRWNHSKGGNDHCMTVDDIQKVLGVDFKKAFPPNDNAKRFIDNIDKFEEKLTQMTYIEFRDYYNKFIHSDEYANEYDEKYSNFRVDFDWYGDFRTINLGGLYTYVYDGKGKKLLLKCKHDGKSDDLCIMSDSIVYYNDKMDSYQYFNPENKESKTIKNVEEIAIINCHNSSLDEEHEKMVAISFKDGITKIYDGYMDEYMNLNNEIDNFKRIMSITSCENDDGENISMADILYYDKEDKPRYAVLDIYRNSVYDDTEFLGAKSDQFIELRDRREELEYETKKLIVDGDMVEDVKDYRWYIDMEGGYITERFLVIDLKDSNHRVYTFDEYCDCELLGNYKKFEYFNYENDYDSDVTYEVIALSKDGTLFDIYAYSYQDGTDSLLFDVKDVKLFRDRIKNSSVPFFYEGSDGTAIYVTNTGNSFTFEELEESIVEELRDEARAIYQDIFNPEEEPYTDFSDFEDFLDRVDPRDSRFEEDFEDAGFNFEDYDIYTSIKNYLNSGAYELDHELINC